jgi:hypothetical protein
MQSAAAEENVDREWVITQQGVAMHGSCVFFVVDVENCVKVFDKGDGKLCRAFGAGRLNGPLDLAINSETREVRRNLRAHFPVFEWPSSEITVRRGQEETTTPSIKTAGFTVSRTSMCKVCEKDASIANCKGRSKSQASSQGGRHALAGEERPLRV